MAQKDYYKILNISYDADKSQIKSAYRKLAAKYHPDSNTEQANEEKFKEINEAYRTLSNNDSKSKYDDEFFNQSRQSSTFNYTRNRRQSNRSFFNWEDIFTNFDFGSNTSNKREEDWTYMNKVQNKDLTYTINESLDELLTREQRTIEVTRYNVCKKCRGFGMNNCSRCKGTGYMKTSYGGMMCTECGGSGLNNLKCSSCKGYGYSESTKNIKVKLNARYNNINIKYSEDIGYYAMVKVSGLGNTMFTSNFNNTLVTGDLYIKILIDIPENITFDKNYNIVQYYPISLKELLFNEYNYITNIENREFKLKIKSANYLSDITFTLQQEGIKTDNKLTNYIFKFKPYFPDITSLTEEEYQELSRILTKT